MALYFNTSICNQRAIILWWGSSSWFPGTLRSRLVGFSLRIPRLNSSQEEKSMFGLLAKILDFKDFSCPHPTHKNQGNLTSEHLGTDTKSVINMHRYTPILPKLGSTGFSDDFSGLEESSSGVKSAIRRDYYDQ